MTCACYLSTLIPTRLALRLRIFLLQGLTSDISTCRLRTTGLGEGKFEGDSCIPGGQLVLLPADQILGQTLWSFLCFCILLNLNVLKDNLNLFVLFEYLKLFKFNNYLIVLCTGRSLENRDMDLQMKSFIYFFTRNLEDFVDTVLKV